MKDDDMPQNSATSLPGNLLTGLPSAALAEVFTPILTRQGCRVERIVSQGQVTPSDQPYCQAWDEWVVLLAGTARVDVAGIETVLAAGDHLLIPAGALHRVTFTDPARPTVWLALHFDNASGP